MKLHTLFEEEDEDLAKILDKAKPIKSLTGSYEIDRGEYRPMTLTVGKIYAVAHSFSLFRVDEIYPGSENEGYEALKGTVTVIYGDRRNGMKEEITGNKIDDYSLGVIHRDDEPPLAFFIHPLSAKEKNKAEAASEAQYKKAKAAFDDAKAHADGLKKVETE